jgi:catechol 2,3-dioxygenase-like lactoylglutathione lyase family enzyme
VPVRRLDHVSLVVADLEAAVAFFVDRLGLEVVGRGAVEGEWVDRVVGLDDVRSEIVMVQPPDGHGRIELTRYERPGARGGEPDAPSNTFGLRTVAFEVDDVEAMVADLAEHGFGLVGGLADYEDVYRLCYVRGPEGIVVMLAQQLG